MLFLKTNQNVFRNLKSKFLNTFKFSKRFSSSSSSSSSSWNPSVVANVSPFLVTRTNGFLPLEDPIDRLPKEYSELELLLQRMPINRPSNKGLLYYGELGGQVLSRLPQYDLSKVTDKRLLMALFRDYTFLASAYLLEPSDIKRRETGKFGLGREKLPGNVAIPLTQISEKLNAKPFMEYAQSYALYNYKRKDKKNPIEYDNLELIRRFSGLPSEDGFILGHVDMVRYTPKLVSSVVNAFDSIHKNRNDFNKALDDILDAMKNINISMEKMWKRSYPKDYSEFRTFIMGTKNQKEIFPNGVVYEGVSDEPTFYRGESGANDSIVPTLDNFLQLTEKMPKNDMTNILKDFRSYRPKEHTEWLTYVEETAKEVSLAEYCREDEDSLLRYIRLVDQVVEFRARHWNFAKEYIIKRTAHPQATGGSPMSSWLPNQLNVVLDQLSRHCKHMEILKFPKPSMAEVSDIHEKTKDGIRKLEQDLERMNERGNAVNMNAY